MPILRVRPSLLSDGGSTLPHLADASLLWVAQEQGLRRIATLDRRDFGIVRFPGGESLENLLDS